MQHLHLTCPSYSPWTVCSSPSQHSNCGTRSPSLTNTNGIVAVSADQRFQFILCFSHSMFCTQAFQICPWALCAPRSTVNVPASLATLWWCHTNSWLTYWNPVGIPHRIDFSLKLSLFSHILVIFPPQTSINRLSKIFITLRASRCRERIIRYQVIDILDSCL